MKKIITIIIITTIIINSMAYAYEDPTYPMQESETVIDEKKTQNNREITWAFTKTAFYLFSIESCIPSIFFPPLVIPCIAGVSIYCIERLLEKK